MLIGIVILALVFCAWPLLKSVISAANKDAPKIVSNSMRGAANMTDALPTMGSNFANSVIIDSMAEVENMKQKLGCVDDKIKTQTQLHQWMEQNGLF